jgi:hypothetical protein
VRQTELLRIRKQNVPVDLALPGAPPRPVEIFLAEHQAHEFRRQHVLDLLEQGPPFLPARDVATGAWEILHKDAVLWIRVSLGPAGENLEAGDELFEVEKRVRVEISGGDPLEGDLLYSAPEQAARVVDYLNQEARFFRLWEGDRLYLINKTFVLRVMELA